MYKTSNDRRFRRNKALLQRAFLDAVVEHGYQGLTVSEITRRADLDRMTFYGHYETIDDVFQEFVDDMEREISQAIAQEPNFDVDSLFSLLNTLMYREIAFFRHVAQSPTGPDFQTAFKNTIARLLRVDHGAAGELTSRQQAIVCDQIAVCIVYSYLDWLAGDYGDAPLEEVVELTKGLLRNRLPLVAYC